MDAPLSRFYLSLQANPLLHRAFEQLSEPADFGPSLASEGRRLNELREIAEARVFIVSAMLLLAAVLFWFSVRLIFARSPGRFRRLFSLWFEAKERELRKRAGKPD